MTQITSGPLDSIRAVVARRRRDLWSHRIASLTMATLAVACAIPLAFVVFDHLAPRGLPRPVMAGAGVVWIVALPIALIGLLVANWRRRFGAPFIARTIEQELEIRHNPIVNSLLLADRADARHAIDGVAAQALRAVGDVQPAANTSRYYGPSLVLVLAVAALWILYGTVASKALLPSLMRFFGAAVAAPSATSIELIRPGPGDRVYAAEPLELEMELRGQAAGDLRFLRQSAAGETLAEYVVPRPLSAVGADRRSVVLAAAEVQGDVHYRCEAGDAVLHGVVHVRPAPACSDLKLRVIPPEYSGREEYETSASPITVLAGTRIEVTATANVTARDPVLEIGGGGAGRVRMRTDGASQRRATAAFLVTESCNLRVLFTDDAGRAGSSSPVRVDVRPDEPPSIRIDTPSVEDAPGDVVDLLHVPLIGVNATDDVGLDAIVMHVENGVVRTAAPLTLAEPYPQAADIAIPESEFDIPIGRSIRVSFEAIDRRHLPDGAAAPQNAPTRTLTLTRSAPPPPEPPNPDDQPAAESTSGESSGGGESETSAQSTSAGNSGKQGAGTPGSDGGEASGEQSAESGDAGSAAVAGGSETEARGGDASGTTVITESGAGGGDGESGEENQSKGTGENAADGSGADPESVAKRIAEENAREIAEARRLVGGETGDLSSEENDRAESAEGAGDNEPRNAGSERAGSEKAGERPDQAGDQRSAQSQPSSTEDQSQPAAPPSTEGRDGEQATTPSREGDNERPRPESGESAESEETEPGSQAEDSPEEQQSPASQPGAEPKDGRKSPAEESRPESGETETAEGDKPDSQPTEGAKQAESNSTESSDAESSTDPSPGDESDPGKSDEGGASDPGKQQSEGKPPGDESGDPTGDQKGEKGTEQDAVAPTSERATGAGDAEPPESPETESGEGAESKSPDDSSESAESDPSAPRSAENSAGGPAEPGADPGEQPPTSAEQSGEDEPAPGRETRTEELLKLLEQLEAMSPEELAALGWDDTRRTTFFRRLEGLREIARAAGIVVEQRRTTTEYRPGDEASAAGTPNAMGVTRQGGESYSDRIRAIQPPGPQPIDPVLQRILDEYYRSLAQKQPGSD